MRHRSRAGQGAREVRKCRVSKRKKRKLAARYRNERAKKINEAFAEPNIGPPPLSSLLTTTSGSEAQRSGSPAQSWPSPPQLPSFNFSCLDFRDSSLFPTSAVPRESSPVGPSHVFPAVPKWCPQIPQRMNSGIWSGEMPKFWDLSRLSELKASPDEKESWRDVQSLPGNPLLNSRQHSRFFSSLASAKPVGLLPPAETASHGLDHSEVTIGEPNSIPQMVSPNNPSYDSIVRWAHSIVAALQAEEEAEKRKSMLSAATSSYHFPNTAVIDLRHRSRESVWNDERATAAGRIPPGGQFPTFELDGRELPHMHRNRLTGTATDFTAAAAAHHTIANHDEPLLADSAIYLADTFTPPDSTLPSHAVPPVAQPAAVHVLQATSLGDSPYSCHATSSAANVQSNIISSSDQSRSSARSELEQELFEAAQVPPPEGPSQSQWDLAAFSSADHAEHCWCANCCAGVPLPEDEEASNELVVDEDGGGGGDDWLILSSPDDVDSDTTSPATTPSLLVSLVGAATAAVPPVAHGAVRRQCSDSSDWDLSAFCTSMREKRPGDHHSHESRVVADETEYEWLWNV